MTNTFETIDEGLARVTGGDGDGWKVAAAVAATAAVFTVGGVILARRTGSAVGSLLWKLRPVG